MPSGFDQLYDIPKKRKIINLHTTVIVSMQTAPFMLMD